MTNDARTTTPDDDADALRARGAFDEAASLDLAALGERLAGEDPLDEALVTELHELAARYVDGGRRDLGDRLVAAWKAACVARVAPGSMDEARMLREHGAYFEFYADDLAAAASAYRASLGVLTRLQDCPFTELRAVALAALGVSLRSGDAEGARAVRAILLEHATREYGAGDPRVEQSVMTAAADYGRSGDHAEAERLYTVELAALDARAEPPINGQCFTVLNRAQQRMALGRWADARDDVQRGLTLAFTWLGARDAFVGYTFGELACCEAELGHFEQAEKLFEQGLLVLRDAKAPDHHMHARTLLSQARMYRARGATDASREAFTAGLAICDRDPEGCRGIRETLLAELQAL